MCAWRCFPDKSGNADSWGSKLTVAAHLLLLFAMVGAHVAIMCCVLHTLWHLVDFVLFFTMNLAHWQFCIVIYNQYEASVGFSCFLQEFVVLSHSAAARITGTGDLKSQRFEIAVSQTFQYVMVQPCSNPSTLVNPQYACCSSSHQPILIR
jgi:hypothetical protein